MSALTPNATIILAPQALPPAPVTAYALLLRRAGDTQPLERHALLQGRHGSRLLVNDAPVPPNAISTLAPSAVISAAVAQADVSAALPYSGAALEVVLATCDAAGDWSEALTWGASLDLIAPRAHAHAQRDPLNRVLITVISDSEDAATITVTSTAEFLIAGATADSDLITADSSLVTADGFDPTGGTQAPTNTITQPWAGDRDGRSGGKAFVLLLPEDADAIIARVTDSAGNSTAVSVPTPPPNFNPPPEATAWALPPWLEDQGSTAPILLAAAQTSATATEVPAQLNPTSASGEFLDEHARTYGTPRYPRERDDSVRQRALAIPQNRHVSRDALEQHLSTIAGVPITISDAGTGLGADWVRLDGSRQLDGTWTLGGPGSDLDPGSYLVRLEDPPRVPMEWVLDELNRLRPAGITPVVSLQREQTTRVGAVVAGRWFDPIVPPTPSPWDFGSIPSPMNDADFGTVTTPEGDEDFGSLP